MSKRLLLYLSFTLGSAVGSGYSYFITGEQTTAVALLLSTLLWMILTVFRLSEERSVRSSLV